MTSYKTRIKNTKDKEGKKFRNKRQDSRGKKRNRIITVTKFEVIDLQKLNSKPQQSSTKSKSNILKSNKARLKIL